MSGQVIRSPRCPGCDALPEFALTGQYFCGVDDCRVLCWNPFDDPAAFKASATVVDLSALTRGDPP